MTAALGRGGMGEVYRARDSEFDRDVAPDGRFLMVAPGEEELAPEQVHIVRNWFQELTARVPVP